MLDNTGKFFRTRRDIAAVYGSDIVKGISASRPPGVIVVVADPDNNGHGYEDKFLPDGSFEYFGQKARAFRGAYDPMRNNNPMIVNHSTEGNELVLFLKTARGYRCEGSWLYKSHRMQPRTIDGVETEQVIFHLVLVGSDAEDEILAAAYAIIADRLHGDLRAKAYAAANQAPPKKATNGFTVKRAAQVVAYALERADGKCEHQGCPAPFKRDNGEPYLEVHHITRLSDGGPDHPAHVAAVCPNCHRELHYAPNRKEANAKLLTKISDLEAGLGPH